MEDLQKHIQTREHRCKRHNLQPAELDPRPARAGVSTLVEREQSDEPLATSSSTANSLRRALAEVHKALLC